MKKLLPCILGAAAAALTVAPAGAASWAEKAQARLARDLEGRVAGHPVECIDMRQVRSSRIVDGEAFVYEAGSTIYVNRPRAGARTLDHWDKLLTLTETTRLCRTDTVRLYDPSFTFQTGLLFLGDFVPYRRPSPGEPASDTDRGTTPAAVAAAAR